MIKSITYSESRDKFGGVLKGSKVSIGIGVGSPVNATGGITRTKIVAPKYLRSK